MIGSCTYLARFNSGDIIGAGSILGIGKLAFQSFFSILAVMPGTDLKKFKLGFQIVRSLWLVTTMADLKQFKRSVSFFWGCWKLKWLNWCIFLSDLTLIFYRLFITLIWMVNGWFTVLVGFRRRMMLLFAWTRHDILYLPRTMVKMSLAR